MPIYEQTYRRWHGRLLERPRTWWVIGRTGVRLLWKKGMILLLLLSSVPFVVRSVQIFLMSRFSREAEMLNSVQTVRGLRIDPAFFMNFLKGQLFFLFFVLLFAGAGLIANDRKYKALTLYFSKPVGFRDYILGKFFVVAFYGSLITMVPALILYLLQLALSQNTVFLKTYWWIPLSIFATSTVILVTLGGLILALSAAFKGTRTAAVFFFALMIFPDMFRQIFSRVPGTALISPTANLQQAGAVLFGLDPPFDFSTMAGVFVLLVLMFLSLLLIRTRIKPTEVVK